MDFELCDVGQPVWAGLRFEKKWNVCLFACFTSDAFFQLFRFLGLFRFIDYLMIVILITLILFYHLVLVNEPISSFPEFYRISFPLLFLLDFEIFVYMESPRTLYSLSYEIHFSRNVIFSFKKFYFEDYLRSPTRKSVSKQKFFSVSLENDRRTGCLSKNYLKTLKMS